MARAGCNETAWESMEPDLYKKALPFKEQESFSAVLCLFAVRRTYSEIAPRFSASSASAFASDGFCAPVIRAGVCSGPRIVWRRRASQVPAEMDQLMLRRQLRRTPPPRLGSPAGLTAFRGRASRQVRRERRPHGGSGACYFRPTVSDSIGRSTLA